MAYIQEVANEIATETNSKLGLENYNWSRIALIELIIIIIILVLIILKIKYKRSKDLEFSNVSKKKLKTDSKSGKMDMNDLMDSINSSKELYKVLSRKCHPDRFVNKEKQETAEAIFQLISKNKRNYKELQLLRRRAENELNLKFK
jgi:hypothetical protein